MGVKNLLLANENTKLDIISDMKPIESPRTYVSLVCKKAFNAYPTIEK